MAFDRNKFKGAKLSANTAVQKEAQANNKGYSNDNGRVGFLSIDEGKNVFRILPPHPDDTVGAAYLPKRVAQLKCEVPVYKDGEDTGKTEVKNKNIFIATQHGGLPKDPIELYIEYVRKRANDEFTDKEDKQKFLQPITGFRDKKGVWNWGISPKTSFVAYAMKDKKMGRLELFESMLKDMNRLAISEESDDVIEIDPFSDPNEGSELIITKQKQVDKQGKELNKWEYPITKGSPSKVKRESWTEYFERTMVTDEQLEELMGQEPLSKIMGNKVYTSRDWDLALDGLRRVDEEAGYQIFENDEFLDELQELEKLVPEYKKDDKDIDAAFDKKKEADKKKSVKVEEITGDEPEAETEDEEVTILDMKAAIKRAIKKNFGIEFMDQMPKKDKDIQKWYQLLDEGEPLPVVTDETEPENAPEPVIETKKTVVSEEGAADPNTELSERIKNLRARGRNKE